jgi:hypothetical protein
MKLSVVMASHNVGPRINANILNACSVAGDDVEVIIRDNSGNIEKRKFLEKIKNKNCHIILVDECPMDENHKRVIAKAQGEFIALRSDDDAFNSDAMPAMLAEIDKIRNHADIIGTAGITVIDDTKESELSRFNNLEMSDPVERFTNFLKHTKWLSVFQFSALRLSVARDAWDFRWTVPFQISYQDLLANCMMLAQGKVTHLERQTYHYCNLNWRDEAMHRKSNAAFFRNAGLDSSCVRLLWLIACVEGVQTFTRKHPAAALTESQRQSLAGCWYNHWFSSFRHNAIRDKTEDAQFDAQAMRLVQKWMTGEREDVPKMIADLSEHFSLSSPEIGQRFYNFWQGEKAEYLP